MTTEHPITPPPKLAWQWHDEWMDSDESGVFMEKLAIQAARWGADQELEACCEWLRSKDILEPAIEALRAVRRPKPLGLAEEALAALNEIEDRYAGPSTQEILVRRALERLQELEEGND